MQPVHDKAPVAVIIPSFNRRELLRRALNSVLAQTVQADEVCVVDDGSTDQTTETLSRLYPDVRFVVQENKGVSAARNLGVKNTSARWIAFLDSDDEWLPQKLERQLSVIEEQDAACLVHCDEIWIRNGRRVNPMNKHRKAGGDIFSQCLRLCAVSPSAALIDRALFNELGGFDESLPACEDYDLWLRVCSQYDVHYVDEPLLRKYGGHDDQLSRKHWGMDRFRVESLAKLLDSHLLDDTPDRRSEALAELKEKCRILVTGARKKGNQELLAYCESLLQRFEVSDVSQA